MMIRAGIRFFRSVSCIGALFVAIGAVGCGGGGDAEYDGAFGTLKGKLTYDKKPVPKGTVIQFDHEKDAYSVSATVESDDGAFTVTGPTDTDIRVGNYKVSVGPPVEDEDADPAKDPAPEKEYKEIPEKYRSTETSGETVEVKEGENTYNLDMKG